MTKHTPNPRCYTGLLFCSGLLLFVLWSHPVSSSPGDNKGARTTPFPWIVSATKAKQLYKQGALLMDVRKRRAYRRRHIQGAVHTTWQHFSSRKIPHIGRLLSSDAKLQQRLRALGVSATKPVLVYGDPLGGWGEEGRLVWTLRSLGHRRAAFVDGGFQALLRAKLPTSNKPTTPTPGSFSLKRRQQWTIQRQQLQRRLQSMPKAGPHLIDARTKREYKGATPYGESRGGHLPGAVHLHYKDLLTKRGTLRSHKALRRLLGAASITPKRTNIAYCTGGVRSAWLVVVLVSLGYRAAKNYPGSMWEWSSYPAKTHPLTR